MARHHPDAQGRRPLRRRGDRIRTCRARDRRVRRLRRSLRSRAPWRGVGRPGRRLRAHRELLGLPDRNLGPSAGRPGRSTRRRSSEPRWPSPWWRPASSATAAAPLPNDVLKLTLSEQSSVRARAVVVASGARYKRPTIANLQMFEGDSVHYWASPVRGQALRRRGDRSGRRRQLGRAGGRVPRTLRQTPDHDRAGRRAGGVDVALSDRPHQVADTTSISGCDR